MRRAATLAILAWAALPAVARAEDACSAFKWSVAHERAAFAAPDLPAASTGGMLPAGGAARVALVPQDSVGYTVKPTRAPRNAPAYGAALRLAAPPATSIAVTLSADAWVDVVQNGKVLRSTGFSGKVGCPGVRKSVRFALGPGPVEVAIRDAPAATIDLAVVPAN